MFDFQEGATLLVDKPLDWTSFDVVKKIRGTIRIKKVGHAGTLDPRATGLLIVCTGRATKTINTLMGQEKEYTGSFELGATTPCYDTEMDVDQRFPFEHLTDEEIHAATAQFIGEIDQLAPIYSALKVKGKKMYELARAGKEVTQKSRRVLIKEFEITKIELPYVEFRIVCSKGTYIRSIAHDFGKALNSGGYLYTLRRTRIGEHRVEDAWSLPDLVEKIIELKT